MRHKDQTRLIALRMLNAALMNREVERRRSLEADESLQVVASLVKQRKDSIAAFTTANRMDLADKESAELLVLETYLPQRLGADEVLVEVKAIVAALAAELGRAAGPGDMGKVMAKFRPRGGSVTKYRVNASAPMIGADGRPNLDFPES